MKAKGVFLLIRCLSGALFLLCPVCPLLGLAQISFANGEWASLSGFAVLFGGDSFVQNEGTIYRFTYRMNPFYFFLIALGFVGALSAFLVSNNRKNLLFPLIVGFFELGVSATLILSFCWMNPGFPLDGVRVGVGWILSIISVSLGLLLLLSQLIFACVKKP